MVDPPWSSDRSLPNCALPSWLRSQGDGGAEASPPKGDEFGSRVDNYRVETKKCMLLPNVACMESLDLYLAHFAGHMHLQSSYMYIYHTCFVSSM